MTDRSITSVRSGETTVTGRGLTVLFSFGLFVSAFLLFVLEPMVAKSILPKLGGTPMVWNTCVMFFQAVLLAGYFAAHVSSRRGVASRAQWFYPAMLLVAAFALPVSFSGVPPPTAQPAFWLIAELVRVVGLPAFALSMTAPVLQAWFSRMRLEASKDPYFLYAASNAGSLLALLMYPTVIEPGLGLQPQARVWAAAYGILGAVVAICAVSARIYDQRKAAEAPQTHAAVTVGQRAYWTVLAFIPSSLMLGVTTYVSTDLAAVPFLWVLPLALYLATFVVAFGRWGARVGGIAERRVPFIATVVVILLAADSLLPIQFDIPLHLLMFTAVALMCHARLAAERPSTQELTQFYLIIAFGGMLGGVFNTLVAPLVFVRIVEYPLVLVLGCTVPALHRRHWRSADLWRDLLYAGVVAVPVAAVSVIFASEELARWRVSALGVIGVVGFSQSRKAPRFALMLAAMLLTAAMTRHGYDTVLEAERTFFGAYHVSLDPQGRFHELYHGTTLHGLEAVDPSSRAEPLVYYVRSGPFGQAFSRLPRLRDASDLAVVGLGVGSLAAYAANSQRWTFYEIDPAVERIARDRQYFHFLESCGSRCQVVLGDARLSLAQSTTRYDAIVLDAFSSDAIPVHLLTREAVNIYRQHLKPGGVLLFHVSNRYLALAAPLQRLFEDAGLSAVEQMYQVDPAELKNGQSPSEWIVASSDLDAINLLSMDSRWHTLPREQRLGVWTDDYSNVFQVLRFRR